MTIDIDIYLHMYKLLLTLYMYIFSFFCFWECSTRVSNELGAGNPHGARSAVAVVMSITVAQALILSLALFASRGVFGYVFSNDMEVVDYVTTMAPLVCLSVILDNLHGVLSG